MVQGVKEEKQGFLKAGYVLLDTGTDQPMSCQMANEEEFAKVKKGDKVALKGDFRSTMIALKQRPTLSDARVVKKD